MHRGYREQQRRAAVQSRAGAGPGIWSSASDLVMPLRTQASWTPTSDFTSRQASAKRRPCLASANRLWPPAPSHSEARTPRISHRLTGIGGGAFERNARMAVSISVRRVSENQGRMRTNHPPLCSTPNRRAAAIQRPTPPSSRRGWARKRSPRPPRARLRFATWRSHRPSRHGAPPEKAAAMVASSA